MLPRDLHVIAMLTNGRANRETTPKEHSFSHNAYSVGFPDIANYCSFRRAKLLDCIHHYVGGKNRSNKTLNWSI